MNWKILAVGVVGAAFGFLLNANGPLGSQLWPMHPDTPEPDGTNLALLMVVGVIEALAFGAGIAFLAFAYPSVKRVMGGHAGWSVAAYLSIAWVLVNWVPHTALHMAHGNITTPADFGGLVGIEYGFHVTLVAAGSLLALGMVRAARLGAATGPSSARAGVHSSARRPA